MRGWVGAWTDGQTDGRMDGRKEKAASRNQMGVEEGAPPHISLTTGLIWQGVSQK